MQDLMPPINTPDKLFHDGDPSAGVEGTIVTAEFMNNEQGAVRDVQQELVNILAAADMSPDSSIANQVLTALQTLFLDAGKNGEDIPDKNLFLSNLGLGEAAKLGSPDFSFSGNTFIAKFPGKSSGVNRTIVIQGTRVTIPQATSGNISTMSVNWPTPFPVMCDFTIISSAGTTYAPSGGPFFGIAPVSRLTCNVSSTYTASASSAFILGVGY